jgi:mannose-6-phosphate isomerase-like protein (cupin superfamily)
MPANTPERIRSLIETIKATYVRRQLVDDAVGHELRKVVSLLEPLPPLTGNFSRNTHAVTRHIRAALQSANDSTAPLLDAIAPVINFLPWRYSYPPRNDNPTLGQNIAFAEIIGPEAPFHSETVCLGLTLIGPKTLYPGHHHPAIELYHVVSGTATWTLEWTLRDNPPGSFILHPTQAIHAMRTHDAPLLAIYTWSGADVRTTSAYTQTSRFDTVERKP